MGAKRLAEKVCPEMTLTAAEIRAFPALDKPYRRTDEKGLYLEICPNGSKRWYFKYRFGEREKRLSLGSWPETSLVAARKLRDQARRSVKEGHDPLQERKKKKIAARLLATNNFQAIAESFIAVRLAGHGRAEAMIAKARCFLSHLTRPIGSRPIGDIELGRHGGAHRPAYHPAREQVDDGCEIKPAFGSPDIGKVRHPLLVGPVGGELTVQDIAGDDRSFALILR